MTFETVRGINTPNQPSKLLSLSYNTEGHVTDIKEAQVDHTKLMELDMPYEAFESLRIPQRNVAYTGKHSIFLENMLTNPDAANILRQDIRMVAFTALNMMPRTFEGFTDFMSSNNPEEEYLRDAAIGVIPKAPSGQPAPRVATGFEGDANIVNNLHRAIVEILGDWIRFDKIGKIRQVSQEMGLAGRLTEEATVYQYITNTANYTRNSTTNDNNVGANTATTTFSADGLRLGMDTIGTAKDRKSGAYLGYAADTIIVGPRLLVPVLQLLRSGQLQRASANNAAEAIGTGTYNPFFGMLSKVVVSPFFDTSYGWALCDSRRGTFKFQTVENFNVYQQTQNINSSEAWLHLDMIEYLVRGYFGVGFVDDRAWFYSDSTTDATVS